MEKGIFNHRLHGFHRWVRFKVFGGWAPEVDPPQKGGSETPRISPSNLCHL
jgi:hypothetical protein